MQRRYFFKIIEKRVGRRRAASLMRRIVAVDDSTGGFRCTLGHTNSLCNSYDNNSSTSQFRRYFSPFSIKYGADYHKFPFQVLTFNHRLIWEFLYRNRSKLRPSTRLYKMAKEVALARKVS